MKPRKTFRELIDELEMVIREGCASDSSSMARGMELIHTLRCEIENRPPSIEHYIANRVDGQLTATNCDYDVLTPTGVKLEVKWSSLNRPGKNSYRWTWDRLTGSSHRKEADRLILVGEKPPSIEAGKYMDDESEFVLFDVPFEEVAALAWEKHDGLLLIQLSVNPTAVRRPASIRLFKEFQVTPDLLRKRYGSNVAVGSPKGTAACGVLNPPPST